VLFLLHDDLFLNLYITIQVMLADNLKNCLEKMLYAFHSVEKKHWLL